MLLKTTFVTGLLPWLSERFPAINFISGIIMYLLIVVGSGWVSFAEIGEAWSFHLAGAGALICLFLLLRVVDEHKDYQKDLVSYPHRVLQSGRITLPDLRWVGVFCFLLMILYTGLMTSMNGVALVSLFLTFCWALLMAKEFFVGEWLQKRLVLYGLTHMVIAPLSVLWILAVLWARKTEMTNDVLPVPISLISLPFMAGMVYEIARKLRGQAEEMPTADSYSQTLGHRRAVGLLTYFVIGFVANDLLLLHAIGQGFPGWHLLLVGICTGLLGLLCMEYLKKNDQKSRKKIEKVAGLLILIVYLSVIWIAGRG